MKPEWSTSVTVSGSRGGVLHVCCLFTGLNFFSLRCQDFAGCGRCWSDVSWLWNSSCIPKWYETFESFRALSILVKFYHPFFSWKPGQDLIFEIQLLFEVQLPLKKLALMKFFIWERDFIQIQFMNADVLQISTLPSLSLNSSKIPRSKGHFSLPLGVSAFPCFLLCFKCIYFTSKANTWKEVVLFFR